MFVVVAMTLVDLHNRLHLGIVVAPVRAHIGCARVRSANASEKLQVGVELLGVRRASLRRTLEDAAR